MSGVAQYESGVAQYESRIDAAGLGCARREGLQRGSRRAGLGCATRRLTARIDAGGPGEGQERATVGVERGCFYLEGGAE